MRPPTRMARANLAAGLAAVIHGVYSDHFYRFFAIHVFDGVANLPLVGRRADTKYLVVPIFAKNLRLFRYNGPVYDFMVFHGHDNRSSSFGSASRCSTTWVAPITSRAHTSAAVRTDTFCIFREDNSTFVS